MVKYNITVNKIFQNNIPHIIKTLEIINQDILKKSLSILKEEQNKLGNKEKSKYYDEK